MAFYKANGGLDDGFCCEAMEIAIFEAKDIAGQMKRTDLAATIRQEFVSSNRAFYHLVDIICGLCLSEDYGVLPVLKSA